MDPVHEGRSLPSGSRSLVVSPGFLPPDMIGLLDGLRPPHPAGIRHPRAAHVPAAGAGIRRFPSQDSYSESISRRNELMFCSDCFSCCFRLSTRSRYFW